MITASQAATVAIRYCTVRRQGNRDANGLERRVITYPGVYYRLLPVLSHAYVFIMLGRDLVWIVWLLQPVTTQPYSLIGGTEIGHYEPATRGWRHVHGIGDAPYLMRAQDTCNDHGCARRGDGPPRDGWAWLQRVCSSRPLLCRLPPYYDVRVLLYTFA